MILGGPANPLKVQTLSGCGTKLKLGKDEQIDVHEVDNLVG